MSDVYEVVDVTDDQIYYTIGIYSTLDLALAELDQPEPPQTHHCHIDWSYADFQVRRRPLDAYSEHGKRVATVLWTLQAPEDDDEEWHEEWRRAVRLVES